LVFHFENHYLVLQNQSVNTRFNESLPSALSTNTAKKIISKIERWVKKYSFALVRYGNWYVGITNNPMNIHRNLGITYKTAWYSAMRVRCSMLEQADMLEGIVEMDEVYIGGKPRHRNIKTDDSVANLANVTQDDWKKDGRRFNMGRGTTSKIKVVGVVERGGKGRVAMKVQDSLTGEDLLKILKRYVNTKEAVVMTDDFRSYRVFDKVMQHYTVNHSKKEYVKYLEGIKDSIHTNTIEGVWSIIKNSIRGQYHVLSKKYLPFYLAEAAYKYNRRSDADKKTAFNETIINAVNDEKCEVNYKPKAYPKFIAYRRKKKKNCK
jgi:transposase-like protein